MPGSRPRKKAPMPLPPAEEDRQGSKVNAAEKAERREGDKGKEEEVEEEENEEEEEKDLERDFTDKDGKLTSITDDKVMLINK